MHGIGNDYIYINCFEENVKDPSKLAVNMSDRHFGIGSDGLVLIMPSEKADFKMRMFNSDGSEAQMCGNAIRCVGKYVYENQMTNKDIIEIETLSGVLTLELTIEQDKVKLVKVDMGEPILIPKLIPVKSEDNLFVKQSVNVNGNEYEITCVSMGNPHAIVYVDSSDAVKRLDLEKIGPYFEHHELFPERINTEFCYVGDDETIEFRVWERGSGETLACGTGACAVLVSSVLNKLTKRKATIKLRGGELIVEWNEKDNHVYLTGVAAFVFEGVYFE